MSVYNRLSRPIGVMGFRSTYMHLCDVLQVNPHNNDVVRHIATVEDAATGEICRLLELHGAEETRDYPLVKSWALDRVRNEARATKNDPRIAS